MEREKDFIKYCPDLTGKEEVKAVLVGQGDYARPVLHKCLLDKCAAFSADNMIGRCKKYCTGVHFDMEKLKEHNKVVYDVIKRVMTENQEV